MMTGRAQLARKPVQRTDRFHVRRCQADSFKQRQHGARSFQPAPQVSRQSDSALRYESESKQASE